MKSFTNDQIKEVNSVFYVQNENSNLIVNRLHFIKRSFEIGKFDILVSVSPLDLDTIFLKTIDNDYDSGRDGRFVRVNHRVMDYAQKNPRPMYLQDIHGITSEDPDKEVSVPLLLFSNTRTATGMVEDQRNYMNGIWADVPIKLTVNIEPPVEVKSIDAIRLESMYNGDTSKISESDFNFLIGLDRALLSPTALEFYRSLVRIYRYNKLLPQIEVKNTDAIRLEAMYNGDTSKISESDYNFLVGLDRSLLSPTALEFYRSLVRIYRYNKLI